MWTEQKLDELLTIPSDNLVRDMAALDGDIMVLGAGGKMGPSLCLLAKAACRKAGVDKKIIAVSRFNDPIVVDLLAKNDITMISSDLLQADALDKLPDCTNIIYAAGRKFGTEGTEHLTWAMNAWLPATVAERFKGSRIVVFSSGNIYPFASLNSGGCTEETKTAPVGEYAMSCLARERMFEYGSSVYGTKVFIYRLNYAVDLRYGVLHDIASCILREEAVSLSMAVFNCIWQGDANEIALRALHHCASPPLKINVTGSETVGVRYAAEELGKLLGKTPRFTGEPSENAILSNAGKCVEMFGYPTIGINAMIKMQAQWLLNGGRSLGKPTHFEERKGEF